MDLKSLKPSDLKAATQLPPEQLVGTVEASTTTSKMNIELTPKNFLETKGAVLEIRAPSYIDESHFFMGDITNGTWKNITDF